MNKQIFFVILIGVLCIGMLCTKGESKMKLNVESHSFKEGQEIPALFSCDEQKGEDGVSPHLTWQKGPDSTRSYVVIMDDPDAPGGTWDHWIVFNIPSTTVELEQNGNPELVKAIVGTNSWGTKKYGGPCPPSGTHRYYFTVYALDTMLSLDSIATKNDVMNAMEGHIVAQGQLMGRYTKK